MSHRFLLNSVLGCTLLFTCSNAASEIGAAHSGQTNAEIERTLLTRVQEAETTNLRTDNLPVALDNLALHYKSIGEHARAIEYYQRSLEAKTRLFGKDDPKVAAALNNLALVYEDRRNFDKAESLYWDAIKILDKLKDAEHPEMTRSLHRLVAVYKARGDNEKAMNLRAQIPIYYEIKGTVADGRYSSSQGGFTIRIPALLKPGARVRDETDDDMTGWQVILTDDLGAFYRIISLDKAKGNFSAEGVLKMYPEAREKGFVETSRGRELRFVDVEKEGAELTVSTMTKSKDGKMEWEKRRPDLATANAVFEAKGRVYHIVAGVTAIQSDDTDRAISRAREKLDSFLSGLVLVSTSK
jgi:tetratricopeptide (TPR) repeat protein